MISGGIVLKIAVIAGDGIGSEVVKEALKVLKTIGSKFNINYEVEEFPYGADYFLETGISIPQEAFTEWPKKFTAILFGAVGDPRVKPNDYAKEILLGIRTKLDLYVNLRPVKLLDKQYCPLKNKTEEDVNFVVVRENIEDIYINSGGNFKKGTKDEVAIENSLHTRKGVERVIRYAFEYANENKLSSVLMSDKSNAMVYVGDLWQRVFNEVAEEYPHIEKRHMYIDALHMELIRDPSQFEVIVTSNIFGDILTDSAAQIQGGMGLAASGNINPESTHFRGLYEPVHGSAPMIAGKNIANPIASILSLAMLLQDHGYKKEASIIQGAVKAVINKGKVTVDLGGNCSTSEIGDLVCQEIQNN